MLTASPIEPHSKDFEEFKHLYHTAFPKAEQVPLKYLIGHPDDTEIEAYYYNNEFCGFYCSLVFGNMMNIMFFAIEDKMRNHGLGTLILNDIKRKHPGYIIMLDVELPEDNAKNEPQRLARKHFYYNNGFVDTDIIYKWHNVDYQMMSYGKKVSVEEYEQFMNHLDNKREKELD